MFCVYLTVYSGNKLPPFYLGSTSISKINSGYRGSVTSKKYADIWRSELKHHPEKFKTRIISTTDTRKLALDREEQLQRALHVVQNPLYVNLAFANRGFLQITPHSSVTRQKISTAKMGVKTGARDAGTRERQSLAARGKKKTLEHRLNISAAKRGKLLQARGKSLFHVRSPSGKEYWVRSLLKFCAQTGLHYKGLKRTLGLSKTATRGQNKGWELVQIIDNPSVEELSRETFEWVKLDLPKSVVKLQSPSTEIFFGTSLEILCKEHGLSQSTMHRAAKRGTPVKHGANKGWAVLLIEHL